jgi:hypothetical protein
MLNPYPIELVDHGDRILLRLEIYDLVRTIHIRPVVDAARQPRTLLGYSTGRWEGATLVVETSRIDYGFVEFGVPQSASSTLVERFTPSPDGKRLDYRFKVIDPETFTEPVEFERERVWRAGEKVMTFNCSTEE